MKFECLTELIKFILSFFFHFFVKCIASCDFFNMWDLSVKIQFIKGESYISRGISCIILVYFLIMTSLPLLVANFRLCTTYIRILVVVRSFYRSAL